MSYPDDIEYYTCSNRGEQIIKCQAIIRTYNMIINRLPNILYNIQQYLINSRIEASRAGADGRLNSCIDEDTIISMLSQQYSERIYIPPIRMWYDILALDYTHGWLPINIKSTTTRTCDNTSNLAMCVWSYTDESLDLYARYQNGPMSEILIRKLKAREYNYITG